MPVLSSSPYAPRHLCKEGQKELRRVVGILIDATLYSAVALAPLMPMLSNNAIAPCDQPVPTRFSGATGQGELTK